MTVQVSIVIPVFNNIEYLAACIDSAVQQRSVKVEIICVDDASTDGSADLLDEISRSNSNVHVLRNTRNSGPGASRNKGLIMAGGKFVRFADADDLLPPDSSALLYEKAVKESVDLVRGSLAIFQGDCPSKVVRAITQPNRNRTFFSEEKPLWIPWWHTSYLISNTLIRENQLRYPDLRRGEDPVFMAKVLLRSRSIALIEDVVYLYRSYQKSTGTGSATFEDLLASLKHAEIVKDLYLSVNKTYWEDGYGPFLKENTQNLIKRCNLKPDQQSTAESELDRIWS